MIRVRHRGIVVTVLDWDFKVSVFELQSWYYSHFRTNTLAKDKEPPYISSDGLNSMTVILL